MIATHRLPVAVILVAVRLEQAKAEAGKRREARRHVLVPLDEQRAHREVGAEARHAALVGDLRDLERHAESLGDRLQRDGLVAHLNPLQRVGVGVGAFVGGDARRDVADVDFELLRKRFLDERDLIESSDGARVVEQFQQRILALVAAVGVEVIGQLAVRRVGRAGVADRGVDSGEPRLVLFQHLGLRPRLADLDLHEEVSLIDGRLQLVDRHRVSHQRDARDPVVPRGERRPVRGGDQVVEVRDAVLAGVEQPRGEIDADEGVEGEGFAQLGLAGDFFGVGVDIVPHRIEQLDRVGVATALELLHRPLGDGVHEGVAAALAVAGKNLRITPEDALRAEPDTALTRGALEHGGALPDLGLVAALETKRPHERLAFKVGADTGDGNGLGGRHGGRE